MCWHLDFTNSSLIHPHRKKAGDMENKLKTAMSEKMAAVQEKSKLEAQLKQFNSQKSMLERTLEKKDAMESKKRESIMVVSGDITTPTGMHVMCAL